MSDLRIVLIQAYQAGQFLEAMSAALSRSSNKRRALASELADLHNEGLVNVVDAFVGLRKSKLGPDFFLARRVFEDVLPRLEAPVKEVMRCVLQLYRDAGVDMAAGTILDAFREFCSKQGARPQEALAEIEASPDLLADLLISTLMAGSHIDGSLYFDETIRLCQHHNAELRSRALFALGKLCLGDRSTWSELALSTLERAAENDVEDRVLASTIESAFALSRHDLENEHRYVAVIAIALSRGNDYTLHAASHVFGFQTSHLSPQLLEVLLHHLMQVKPANKRTLDNIDYGISQLLGGNRADSGLRFLEDLLLAHPNELALKNFDDATRTIRDHGGLHNKVITRWFLRGAYPLCEGIDELVKPPLGGLVELEVDMSELVSSHPKHFQFVARKAIGYLFLNPITAASFLISLLRNCGDEDVVIELRDLLLNPLLINFPGSLGDYITERAKLEAGSVKIALDQALRGLEEYLDGLRSVGDLPAHCPSEAQREAYRRHMSQQVAESFKAAEAESVLLQLVTKTVLLYGRKAVNYVYGPEGESRRMETPLLSHGTEIEVPRMQILDPHGLDYMLRIFRRESL